LSKTCTAILERRRRTFKKKVRRGNRMDKEVTRSCKAVIEIRE